MSIFEMFLAAILALTVVCLWVTMWYVERLRYRLDRLDKVLVEYMRKNDASWDMHWKLHRQKEGGGISTVKIID